MLTPPPPRTKFLGKPLRLYTGFIGGRSNIHKLPCGLVVGAVSASTGGFAVGEYTGFIGGRSNINKLPCGLVVGAVAASTGGFAVGETGWDLKADHVAAINRRPINGPRGTEVALVNFIPSAMTFFF